MTATSSRFNTSSRRGRWRPCRSAATGEGSTPDVRSSPHTVRGTQGAAVPLGRTERVTGRRSPPRRERRSRGGRLIRARRLSAVISLPGYEGASGEAVRPDCRRRVQRLRARANDCARRCEPIGNAGGSRATHRWVPPSPATPLRSPGRAPMAAPRPPSTSISTTGTTAASARRSRTRTRARTTHTSCSRATSVSRSSARRPSRTVTASPTATARRMPPSRATRRRRSPRLRRRPARPSAPGRRGRPTAYVRRQPG